MTSAVPEFTPSPKRDPWGPRQREVRGRIWGGLWDTWLHERDPAFGTTPLILAKAIASNAFQLAYEGLVGLAAIADSLDRCADALERERPAS